MFRSVTNFEKHVDKATSISNLGPDWDAIIAACDCVKTQEISPRRAVDYIKDKLKSTNPNIVLRSLEVLESCVKNCGSNFNLELASSSFMNDYVHVLRTCKDPKVRDKILELLANWAYAFRNEPAYMIIAEKVKQLKLEGYKFPVLTQTNDALFTAKTAPVWVEGPCCHRCRTEFTLVNRRHHCRHCGQVFCQKCSSKNCAIPDFGFETPVRVCDFCYDKLTKKSERRKEKSHRSSMKSSGGAPSSSSGAPSAAAASEADKKKSEEELKAREEEEFQLALALSLSENENKARASYPVYKPSNGKAADSSNRNTARASTTNASFTGGQAAGTGTTQPKRSKSKTRSGKSKSNKTNGAELKLDTNDMVEGENMDPEMERYLNRDYWVNRMGQQLGELNFSPSPSAPAPSISSAGTLTLEPFVRKEIPPAETNGTQAAAKMIGQINAVELEQFKSTLRGTLDIFINRLNLNKLRGRAITNDHGVQTMFLNLTNMHSKMVHYSQQTSDARANCERLQDKYTQIRDARGALDALREEHRDEIRRQQEEAERLKQGQMAQKLEIMRQKKQEYLQYQREMAIHRMQEQERELQMMRASQQATMAGHQAALAWQSPGAPQQYYQPAPMQYAQPPTGVPIGAIPPVSDPSLQQQQPAPPMQVTAPQAFPPQTAPPVQAVPPQQPQPQPQFGPQVYGPQQVMPQYGPPPTSVAMPYGPQPGLVPGQFPGYGVYGQPQQPSPMHQPYAQPPPPQQQGFQQMAHQQPMPQQQPQPEPAAAPVDEAPLINFD